MPNQPNGNVSNQGLGQTGQKSTAAGSTVRPQKISDALRVLDEAISGEGANLKDLVTKEFAHLQSALGGITSPRMDRIRETGSQAMTAVQDYAAPALEAGREAFATVDRQVRTNPWPVLGGVALGSLALGFLLGRSGSND